MYGIYGKIGSGKSTLLFSILNQVQYYQGFIQVKGKIAYVEQEPILFSGTFKENILFGREFN
jgi:ATP-binding cassette, subfamily C (CFTR/MRP), member 4